MCAAAGPFRYWRDPVCLGAVALYLGNRFIVKPATGDSTDFFHSYVNDILCLPFWLPIVLWVQRRVGVRKTDLPPTVGEITLHWLVWSWFFEAFAPSLPGVFIGTVADPWDVVAYAGGGVIAAGLWRSQLDPMRRGVAGWRPWLVNGMIASALLLAVLGFAVAVGLSEPIQRERPQTYLRWSLMQTADALTAFRTEHGSLPERLDDLSDVEGGTVDEYRRSDGAFVLIAYGADRRPGGVGDAEDVYVPVEHQPPSPWYSWFFTSDGRITVAIGCVVGTLLAILWLAGRASAQPPFAPLNRRGVCELVTELCIALVFAAVILGLHRTTGH